MCEMKRFLIYILLFYSFTLAFFASLEFLARQAPNPYKAKTEYMLQHADSVEILIFGSSHNYYGLRAELFSLPTYSLANVSQSVYYDYMLLNKYIDSCSNLRYVICDMSVFSPISRRMEEGKEGFRATFYELYMGFDNHSVFSKYHYELSNPEIFKSKIGLGVKELISKSDLNALYPGGGDDSYSARLKRFDGWDDAKYAVERHVRPFDEKYYNESNAYFMKMAELCKSRNVVMVYVTTPTMSGYYKRIPPARIDLMQSIVKNTQRVWKKTYYINLLEDGRFDDKDFYDCDHLNYENGAVKLSKILNDTILTLN